MEHLATAVVAEMINPNREIGARALRPLQLERILTVGQSLADIITSNTTREKVKTALKETDRLRKTRNDLLHSYFVPDAADKLRQTRRIGTRVLLRPSNHDSETLAQVLAQLGILSFQLLDVLDDGRLFNEPE